jgi:hypothetical protein
MGCFGKLHEAKCHCAFALLRDLHNQFPIPANSKMGSEPKPSWKDALMSAHSEVPFVYVLALVLVFDLSTMVSIINS